MSQHRTSPGQRPEVGVPVGEAARLALLAGQKEVLELIAGGAPLDSTLDKLLRVIEGQAEGALCSVLLLDEEGCVRHGAAPSLPSGFVEAVDGQPIGPKAGSCGTAAYRGEPVIVEDIAQDPLWEDYRELALSFDLAACWSTPIFDRNGTVLGTFAIYYREPRLPDPLHRELIAAATDTAAIAIERASVEQAFEERRHQLRLFVEHSPAAVALFDREMRYMVVSSRWRSDYRLGDQEIEGRTHYEVFPEIPERWKEIHRRCLAGAVESCERDPFPRANGTLDWVRWEIRPWRRGDGEIGGIVMLSEVITERVEAEVVLEEKERLLSESQRIAHLGSWSWDAESDRIEWSDETYRIFGVEPESFEPSGAAFLDRIHPEDRPRVEAWFANQRAGAESQEMVYRALRPDGAIRFIRARGFVERREDVPGTRMLGTVQDITEQRLLEEEFRTLADRYRDLVENSSDLICTHDLDGVLLSVNATATELLGYPEEQMVGRSMRDLVEERFRPGFDAYLREIEREGYAEGILRLRAADGESVFLEYKNTLRSEDVTRPVVRGSARDVTDRIRAESALAAKTAELERYFDTAMDLFCIADTGGTLRRLNAQWEETLGFPVEELEGRNFMELVHPDDAAATLARLEEIEDPAETSTFVNRYRCRDGSYRWIEWRSRTVDGLIYAAARDITARRESELALEENRERLRLAVQAGEVALWDWDLDTDQAYFSFIWKSQLGYADDEIGFDIEEWRSRLHAEDRERTLLEVERCREHPDREYRVEYRLRHRDGSWRHMLANGSVVTDNGGRALRLVGTQIDLTDRVELETQLRHAQRMESIGRLAGGVAHDFNNLLTVINGYADMAARELAPDQPLRNMVEEIARAGARAAVLTRQLLAFSRRQAARPVVLDLNEVVGNIGESLLHRLLGEKAELVVRLAEGLPSVEIDRGQIEQIVMNLAINARDAMPEGGKLVVSTSYEDGASTQEVDDPPRRPESTQPAVVLTVTDTGEGMSPETRERIFEPFFTTKGEGRGTGLGLSTVYGIVQQAGGRIEVETELGKGSSFSIHLPPVAKEPARKPPAVSRGEATGTETILLAEDNDSVRRLAQRILEEAGYRVLPAENGMRALDILEEASEPIDLLITDLVMPGISGNELLERVRVERPALKALFISGYSKESEERAQDLEGAPLVPKPFTSRKLLRKVRRVLDEPLLPSTD